MTEVIASMAHLHPRILAILPGFTASTMMDVINPLLRLESEQVIEFRVTLEFYTSISAIQWADLVIFCRNTEPKYQHILDHLLAEDIPFIYDLDDNLYEIPLDHDLGRYHRAPERLGVLNRYLQSASLVRVYSQELHEQIRELNANIHQVVAPLDWELIQLPRKRRASDRLKIVYVTSRKVDDRLFSMFRAGLLQALQEFEDQVEMYFWGSLPDDFKDLPNVRFLKFVPNYNAFMRRFSQSGFDIGLAPLIDDRFHRAKTNNKYREYAACSVAGIYSQVDVYTSCIQDGETGLIVSNDPESWYRALKRLITDQALRKKIVQNAKADVQQHYAQDQFHQTWWDQIQSTLDKKRPLAGQRVAIQPDTALTDSTTAGSPRFEVGRKLPQILSRIRDTPPKKYFATLGSQLYNWWLLLKINQFGRL